MSKIICIKCGKEIEVEEIQKGQDVTTFVCEECQEAINLPAYQEELKSYQAKSERTESEDKRVEFLKAKISKPTLAKKAIK